MKSLIEIVQLELLSPLHDVGYVEYVPEGILLQSVTNDAAGLFNSSPDTSSPVYPDRLIRPLPKRTLRSRLSSDSADSIRSPAAPSSSRIFYDTAGQDTKSDENQDQSSESDIRHPYEHGLEYDSRDEDGPEVVRRNGLLCPSTRPPSYSTSVRGSEVKPSTVDGYDAIENINNKNKRKIPSPANLSRHSTLYMGLSVPASSSGDVAGTYYGTGNRASPASGEISGPGRGRFTRNVSSGSGGRNTVWGSSRQAEPTGKFFARYTTSFYVWLTWKMQIKVLSPPL